MNRKEAEDTFKLYDLSTNLESKDYSENIGEEIFKINKSGYERSTYIPQGEAEGDYSGNIHISKNKPNSFEINDASQILDKKQVSKQTTLL